MNTNTKTAKTTKLIPVFALWSRKDKNGKDYFTGKVEKEETKLVAFYNQKRSMKDSDINVFTRDGEKLVPYAKLWVNVSKNGKKYLSGKMGEQRITGFFNEKHTASQPYVSIYTESTVEAPASDAEPLPF